MNTVSDIATDPSIPETVQANGRIVKNGSRNGIDIRVVIEPASKGAELLRRFRQMFLEIRNDDATRTL